MIRRIISLTVLMMILLTAVSCGSSSKPSDKQLSTSAPGTALNPAEKDSPDPGKTAAADPDFVLPDTSQRPFAVMIDNEGTRPLPQGGLNKAQVIYEIVVEGGVTRLMPLFWGTEPEMIGPVRSSRHYFLDYVLEHDAIYVHFGGSPMAYTDLKKLKINDMDGVTGRDGGIFWDITKDKNNWQDSYTSMEKVKAQTAKLKYRTNTDKTPVFRYNTSDVIPNGGQQAEKVDVKYTRDYSCGYTYDQATGKYLRFRKEKPHMERTTNQQLTAKNILIQFVKNNSIEGDDKGRQVLGDVGKGEGWFITDGKAQKITWSKASRDAQTLYRDEAGSPVMLNPGQTWIQILPITGNVTFNASSTSAGSAG